MTGSGDQAIRDVMAAPVTVAYPGRRGDGGDAAELDLRLANLERNDVDNAQRLIGRHGHELRFVREFGWLSWVGTHWERHGADHKARILAHDTAAMIIAEVAAVIKDGPRENESIADHRKRQEDLFTWRRQSGNRAKIEAMLIEAAPYLAVDPSDLDADPMVLNLKNGTLRLAGACQDLAAHDQDDLLAKVIDVEFDPDATCPRFLDFLARVQPSADVRGFLQRYAGYCLTGSTAEQVMVFNYGTGANGKSTFVNIVAKIMGPYSVSLPFASLLRNDRTRGADATPDLARLPGARLVRASEPEKGARFAEATIKSVTGGEEITARRLHQEFFDFDPQFKLMTSGNNKPAIRGCDEGIWRRIALVPWEVFIPPEERAKGLDATLWAQRSGILNWMLDGCRLWLEEGLMVPDAVRDATKQYRVDSDPIGRFLEVCVTKTLGSKVAATDMYYAYTAWCASNAEQPWKQRTFGDAMTERGFTRHKSSIYRYCDVALVTIPIEEANK
jgi:putative DNA primase/helicase